MPLVGLLAAWAAAEPVPPLPTPASWELEWTAPSECPDAAAIREQVAALVPEPGAGEGVLYVDAEVVPQGGGFVLALRTDFAERQDEREVRARVCGELAEAVALVVAVSLDPALASSRPSVPAPRPTVPEALAPPEPDAPAPPVPEPGGPERKASAGPTAPRAEPRAGAESTRPAATTPEPVRRDDASPQGSKAARAPTAWMLRLAPKLELGTLPAVAGGLELAVGMQWRWWQLELHGAHSWPRRALGPEGSAGRFQLGAVGVRGCGRPLAGPVELPVCVGLEGGALRVDSEGLEPATTVHGPWLAQSLGVGIAAGGTRARVWAMVEGSATLVWSRILVGETTLFRPFPVSARGLVGLELRFAIISR